MSEVIDDRMSALYLLDIVCQTSVENIEVALRTSDKYLSVLRVIIDFESMKTEYQTV